MMIVSVSMYNERQTHTLNLNIDGNAYRFTLDIRHSEILDKWLMTIDRADDGVSICRDIPLVSSGNVLNDLLAPFGYKGAGRIGIISPDRNEIKDPSAETLADFEFVWGDSNG